MTCNSSVAPEFLQTPCKHLADRKKVRVLMCKGRTSCYKHLQLAGLGDPQAAAVGLPKQAKTRKGFSAQGDDGHR